MRHLRLWLGVPLLAAASLALVALAVVAVIGVVTLATSDGDHSNGVALTLAAAVVAGFAGVGAFMCAGVARELVRDRPAVPKV